MTVANSRVTNLEAIGPIIDLQVGVPAAAATAMQKQQQAVPLPVKISALIDTVASHSCIKQGIPGQLGLNPVGMQPVSTPSSQNVPCGQYFMRLVFPSMHMSIEGVFLEAPFPGQNIECLIGRDILSHGLLVYNG